jgi:LPXTG-motif cell wall-anchored protein
LSGFDGQTGGGNSFLMMGLITVGLAAVGFMAYRRRQNGRGAE